MFWALPFVKAIVEVRSNEGLTLESSALKLFTVANLHYQLGWLNETILLYSFTDVVPHFLKKLTGPLSSTKQLQMKVLLDTMNGKSSWHVMTNKETKNDRLMLFFLFFLFF